MSLTKAWSLIVILHVAALAPLHVFAQVTANVSCLSPTYDWMNNTKNQNPCLVAVYLAAACNGGQYGIDPLPIGYFYGGPNGSQANVCQCSTVTYSLVSACGDCQNRTYVTWSSWSSNCTTTYPSQYEVNIPTDTVVPHWAYLDVVTGDTFSPSAALQAGDAPESTATGVQSTSSIVPSTTSTYASLTLSPTIATGSPSQTQSPTSTSTQSPTSTSKSSNVGAIAGGVIGGVAGIAVIAGLAARFFVKRRRSTTPPSAAFSNIGGGPGYTQSFYSTNPHLFPMPTQMAQQPRLYDPSDPSTFPTYSLPPTTLTTSTSNIYQNPSIPSHVYSQQSRPVQYNGAPEV